MGQLEGLKAKYNVLISLKQSFSEAEVMFLKKKKTQQFYGQINICFHLHSKEENSVLAFHSKQTCQVSASCNIQQLWKQIPEVHKQIPAIIANDNHHHHPPKKHSQNGENMSLNKTFRKRFCQRTDRLKLLRVISMDA